MSNREKWITVLMCLLVLIVCAGFGIFKTATPAGSVRSTKDLSGRALGGVKSRMPEAASKIFFESLMGVKLSALREYDDYEEALYALRTGRVAAVWTTDTGADYLLDKYDGLMCLDNSEMADIADLPEGRFSFGVAAKNNEKGKKLTEEINAALDMIEEKGILESLRQEYIVNAADADPFTPKDMISGAEGDVLVVGITGAAIPVELIDENGEPYGFCVALMDEIGQILKRRIEFEVLDNETVFSDLMSGRIDLVFAYGAGNITTEGAKNWVMSRGYLDMKRYRFITMQPGE